MKTGLRKSGMKHALDKSVKELRCLYDIASITGAPDISLHERFAKIVKMLPRAFQYPEIASARITLNGEEFKTENYRKTDQKISADIMVQGTKSGTVEIGYIKTPPTTDKDLFSKEERLLMDAVAERLGTITEHRRAEEALEESEEKFSKAFHASPNAMVITSQKDGRFIEVNDSHIHVTGFTREETIGRTTTELNAWVNPKDRRRIVKILEEKGHVDNEEIQFRTKSGKIYTGLFSAEKVNIGGEPCLISVSIDITEQKQSQEILQTVSHSSPLGIYITQDDRLQYTNPQFQKITGYTQKELLGRELLSLVAIEDSDVVRSCTAFTLQEDNPYPCEYRILNKTGQIKWVMQTVCPIHYEGREAILGNLMDITERKYLERKVIEYEELSKMKSDLLATVSHELRTPLSTIKGYSTMILDYSSRLGSDETMDYLKSIDNSADRLTKLVDNLLDTSRMEAGLLKLERSPTNISQLIQKVAAEAGIRAGDHKIITKLNDKLPRLNIDVKRIRQVLDNLIDNAIKYSPQGTEVLISAKKNGRELLVSINDQGAGIPAEELTGIFDRMYRIEQRLSSDVDGMGLGLYICQGLVEAHGGRIWAESTVGQGSTIQFTLPITSTVKRKMKRLTKSARRKNSLVVEDNIIHRKVR
ncbi:MAG: PAS domain S-box protein [Dehalococcoidales bacterium]|nr:PAS domain S-box protein [Dehalococcoidales bacterium]